LVDCSTKTDNNFKELIGCNGWNKIIENELSKGTKVWFAVFQ
jgi:hypothetical protein